VGFKLVISYLLDIDCLHQENTHMRISAEVTETPVTFFVVTWVLAIPLVCFAANGMLWFGATATHSELAARFGSLATAQTATSDNIIVNLLILSVLAILVPARLTSILQLCRTQKVFVAIGAWVSFSFFWSQFPKVSLEWAPIAVLNILFAFYLYECFEPDQQISFLLLIGWICLTLSVFLALFFPQYGVDIGATHPWRGMYPQKNMCSMVTTFFLLCGVYAPAASVTSKLFRAIYISASIVVIIMTQSATGKLVLALLVVYFVFTTVISKLSRNDRTAPLILGAALAVLFACASLLYAKQISIFMGKDPTLTGRTQIWNSIESSILKRPILGYGYRAYWRGYEGESANVSLSNYWAVTSAHNGLLEIWLTLGVVGVTLIVYSLLKSVRNAFKCLRATNSRYFAWCAAVVFLTIITNVDEGEILIPNSLLWILYVLASIGLSEGARMLPVECS
jgi:exopolysaccharide production protein ExoQ